MKFSTTYFIVCLLPCLFMFTSLRAIQFKQDNDSLMSLLENDSEQLILNLERKKFFSKKEKLENNLILGKAYRNLGDFETSLSIHEKVYLESRNLNLKEQKIAALIEKGKTYKLLDEYEEALIYFEKAISLMGIKSIEFSAPHYLLMADTYKELKDFVNAYKYAKNALSLYEQTYDKRGQAESLNLIGSILWNQSEYEKELEYYKNALDLRIPIGDAKLISKSYVSIGLTYKALGDFERALHHYNLAMEIVDKTGSKFDKANVYNHLGSLYFTFHKLDLAKENYRISLCLRKQLKNPMLISATYENLGNAFRSSFQYDSATFYLSKAIQIREIFPNRKFLASSYNALGNVFWHAKLYSDALVNQFKALKIYEEDNALDGMASTYKNIALIYKNLENFEKSIQYFDQSNQIYNKINDKVKYSSGLNYIGNLYNSQGDYKMALVYYEQAYKIRFASGNKGLIEASLANLAMIHDRLGNEKLAKEHLLRALDLCYELKRERRIAYLYHQLGNHYRSVSSDSAFYFYQKSFSLAEKIDYKYISSLSARKIAEHYYSLEKYLLAENYLFISLQGSKELKELEFKLFAYDLLFKIKKKQHDFEKALFYYQNYEQVKDSLNRQKFNNDLFTTQLNLEVEKNKTLLSKIEQEITVIKREKKIQKQLIIYTVFSLFLVSIILLLYINRFKIKKRSTKLLQEKITEINIINKRLRYSEKKLLESNRTKDRFFSIIAHDLKNPFNGLIGLSSLLNMKAESMETEDVKRYSKIIHHSTLQVYGLLENLLDWSLSQMGGKNLNPENINLDLLVEKNLDLADASAKKKSIRIVNRIAPEISIWADFNSINTVLRNLINNAIKYTPQSGEIIVDATVYEEYVEVMVKDNGVGISEEQLDKLFVFNEQVSTKGTSNEGGSGLGLVLCKDFIEKNNGKIWVESSLNVGTSFFFSIPKSKQ